nr:MAG TPA: hypothetical protein [Bacteriophage sp.]
MADISKINLGGTVYNIKDSVARDAIVNTLKFKGITTVAITEGGTQVPTDIYDDKATAADIRVGDLVVYGKAEYVWIEKKTGETTTKQWCMLDALNAYGKLASKDSASGTTSDNGTHKHTVAVPTWIGTATTFTGEFTPAGGVTLTAAADGVKTAGTVSAPTITLAGGSTSKLKTATAKAVTGTGKAVTSVALTNPALTTGTATFVTGGTVSAPTAGIKISAPTSAALTNASATSSNVVTNATYTAATETLALTIGAPTITVAKTTGNFVTSATSADKFVTGVTHSLTTAKGLNAASLSAGSVTVGTAVFAQGATEFTYATGAVAADGTGSTVVTALHTGATATAPTFTATTGLKATLGGTKATISVSGTPKLKKSTAETLNTSDAGVHHHTVTVQ